MFFLGKEQVTSVKTLHNCSFVIRQFFNFIAEQFDKSPIHLTIMDLDAITVKNIECYMENLSNKNTSGSIGQQIYTLNTFFKYYYKLGKISHNVIERIEPPQRKEKPVIRLNNEEIVKVLDAVDNGYRVKNGKRRLGKLHLLRDKTILVLFLSTGIRLSELVGLDYGDTDLETASFTVRRKGGKRELCYMTDECVEQLKIYFQYFPKTSPNEPLFLSIYKTRAGTKSIQDLVKKYCKVAGIQKKITPHKLRSTFGTNMYEKTRDIYMVADLLGHKDVKTTTKHYTTVKEDLKREALRGFSLT